MSSFTYRFLTQETPEAVAKINSMMKSLHSKSEPLTIDDLITIINSSKVVIAENEDQVIGVAMMVKIKTLALQKVGQIHSFYVSVEEINIGEVFKGLIEKLAEYAKNEGYTHLDCFVNVRRPQFQTLVSALAKYGFRQRHALCQRLAFK